MPRAGGEAGVWVERPDAPRRAPAAAGVEGDEDARAVVALDHARGHDPDHPRVPTLAREDVRGAVRVLGTRGLGGEEDARLHVLALAVQQVELVGDLLGALLVLREHELE